MRPVINNGVAIFSVQGFIDSIQAESFLTMSDLHYLSSLELKAIFISLKKVIFFNKKGIESLIDILNKLKKDQNRPNVLVGFLDYQAKDFSTILHMFDGNLSVNLIKDEIALSLLVGEPKLKTTDKILIWSDDSTQKNTMIIRLYERGFKTTAASNYEEYENALLNESADYILDNTFLGEYSSGFSSQKVGNVIIYKFDKFVDAKSIESFDLTYHQHSLNNGFVNFVFDFETVKSMNIHGVTFLAKLSIGSAEYGATIAIAGINRKVIGGQLIEELEDAGIIFFNDVKSFISQVDNSDIEEHGGVFISKNTRNLTKQMIQLLPTFVDACVHSLNILTNTTAVKKLLNIQPLDIDKSINKKELIATSIGFYGDIEGMIILVVSKNIAKKATLLFIGEEVDTLEELHDSMEEFVNIIGGQTKQMLSEQKIKIKITLPNVYEDVALLETNIHEKKGVEVLLYFNEEPFYLYITR